MRTIKMAVIAFAMLSIIGAHASAQSLRVNLGGLAPLIVVESAPVEMQDCPAWDPVTLEPSGTQQVPANQECPDEPVKVLVLAETASTSASVGQAFHYSVMATGGRGTLTYTLVDNPAGMTLTGNALSGTFSTAGTRTATVSVSDQSTPVQTRQITVSVSVLQVLAFSTQPQGITIPAGGSGLPIIGLSGATSPFTYELVDGPIAGVSMNPGTGQISIAAGTPIGIHQIRTRVTDAEGRTGVTIPYELSIGSSTAITLKATLLDGSTVRISGWNAIPRKATFVIGPGYLRIDIASACGRVSVSIASNGALSNSWNGACNTGYTHAQYFSNLSGQSSTFTATNVVIGASDFTSQVPTWQVQ